MKDNTKKLIVLGGLGAVGIYFLTRGDEEAAGFGGTVYKNVPQTIKETATNNVVSKKTFRAPGTRGSGAIYGGFKPMPGQIPEGTPKLQMM